MKITRKISSAVTTLVLALTLAVGAGVSAATPAEAAPRATTAQWNKIAKCESTGRWSVNTGNGHYGGLQFNLRTWRAYGGKGYPHRASKAQQIKIANKVLKKQGWNAWPGCSRKLGYRR